MTIAHGAKPEGGFRIVCSGFSGWRDFYLHVDYKYQGERGAAPLPPQATCLAASPGAESTDRDLQVNWARQRQTDEIVRNLNYKYGLLFNCPAMNIDQLSSAFATISVIIAKAVPDPKCFDGDAGVTATDWASHKGAFADRAGRASVLFDNLKWKTAKAFGCIAKDRQADLFADISVAIAQASK